MERVLLPTPPMNTTRTQRRTRDWEWRHTSQRFAKLFVRSYRRDGPRWPPFSLSEGLALTPEAHAQFVDAV